MISNRRLRGRPDFHQLETFLKVAETRSFAAAARQMGVSQPAVSQTIARLEELYGGDLFERRRGAPAALTPIGRAIFPKAKLLLFTVDQQIERALATAQSYTGSLSVGFYTGLALGPLKEGIADFRLSRPDVELRIVESSPAELHRALNERSLDIIFSAYVTEGADSNQQERLWEEPMVVALQDTHPFTAKDSLRWADLAALPLMMRSHGGDLTAYRTIASRMGEHPFQCDLHDVSRGALIELVRLGLGATISFASAVVPRDGVAFLPIVDDNSNVGIDAIWPRDDRNPLRHRLLSLVRKHAATH
ncbi:LysR family transcriptional regulator [Sphingomonas sp.]|uniref:LysR family transcriptional regulator n=1 Tax=Sphingomonas sp. TaxID=28214 RepID=UPI0025EB1BBD|nr:LysR family transcriptional regulator [Sphingomonas sp.]MBV9527530.1 LysR family transcriptional regulator [Sphingomonas sp.]